MISAIRHPVPVTISFSSFRGTNTHRRACTGVISRNLAGVATVRPLNIGKRSFNCAGSHKPQWREILPFVHPDAGRPRATAEEDDSFCSLPSDFLVLNGGRSVYARPLPPLPWLVSFADLSPNFSSASRTCALSRVPQEHN
jgi:hypothetical protein